MTQEELDSLMDGVEDGQDISQIDSEMSSNSGDSQSNANSEEYFRVEANKKWPPPPPSEDHKVVHQLDDVTKDSEVKGTQIFDQLEVMSDGASNIEKQLKSLKTYIDSQEDLLKKLSERFPHIQSFQNALNSTNDAKKYISNIKDSANDINDASMQAMDLMQYQDIHRQKIERVINVMRALSQYMNSLFESKVDDSKRVSSAVYIAGDNKEDVADENDIEALIASFGAK